MLRNVFTRVFTVVISFYVLIHYVLLLINNGRLLALLSIVGIAALFFGLLLLKGKAAILPLFLIFLAVVISIGNDGITFFDLLWEGSRTMRSLIAMLLIVPIVGWVLKQENYVEDSIILLKRRLTNSKTFYFMLMFMTQLISFFLLFGSIAVVHQIVHTFFPDKDRYIWKMFKSTSVLRGFALTTIWVISIPSFAFSVEVLDASLFVSLVQGFFLSLAGLLLAVFYLYVAEKKQQTALSRDILRAIAKASHHMDVNENPGRVFVEFILLFVSLLTLTLIVNGFMPVGLLTVIPIVVIVWALAYFLIKNKWRALFTEAKTYFSKGIALRSQEVILFLSAGLLITGLNQSGLSDDVMNGLYHWTEQIPGLNFLWVLPLIVMLFGFIGLGPLMVMVLIAEIIRSIHLPYPPELIVLAMTLGSTLSVMISPLVAPVLFLSSMNKLSPFENSAKQNWLFALSFYLLVELYIQFRIL